MDSLPAQAIENRQRFANRTAGLTGGGTGMGRAAALRLARDGARVVIAGRRAGELDAVAALVTGQSLLVDSGFTLGGPRPWLRVMQP